MTQQNGPLARDEGAGPADHPTNQEQHAMTLPVPAIYHRGHPLDETNLRYDCRGVRQCRLCRIDVERAYRNRRFARNHPDHNVIMLRNGRRYCITCIRGDHNVDEMAVERAASGDPPGLLTAAEREAAVLQLRSWGLSRRVIADRVGCHMRTVSAIYSRTRQRAAA